MDLLGKDNENKSVITQNLLVENEDVLLRNKDVYNII